MHSGRSPRSGRTGLCVHSRRKRELYYQRPLVPATWSAWERLVALDVGESGGLARRMKERASLESRSGPTAVRLTVLLLIFALITLTVGLVTLQTVRVPYATLVWHPFFTDTRQMKAWLATAAVILAGSQLITAARIYGLLRFPPKGRLYHRAHRWSGRATILLTLPVAYHCGFLFGFSAHSPRVLIHSLLGSALYGAVVVKVLVVRSSGMAWWVLPVAGGLLFLILLGLWLTSALWFFAGAL
jgi:uncharacterized protein DUF6529